MIHPRTIGIIAGSGVYPKTFVHAARRAAPGIKLVVAAFDGETNPEIFIKHRMAIRGLKDAVSALTAAYVITADDKYASKAATLLRTFFLDDGTRVSG